MVWNLENLQGFAWRTTCDSMTRVHFSILILQLFGSHCNNYYFWDTGLKICRLTNMLFQFLQTFFSESELVFGLKKVDYVTPTIAKGLLLSDTPKFYKNFKHRKVWWVMMMVHLNLKFLLSTVPLRFSPNHFTH